MLWRTDLLLGLSSCGGSTRGVTAVVVRLVLLPPGGEVPCRSTHGRFFVCWWYGGGARVDQTVWWSARPPGGGWPGNGPDLGAPESARGKSPDLLPGSCGVHRERGGAGGVDGGEPTGAEAGALAPCTRRRGWRVSSVKGPFVLACFAAPRTGRVPAPDRDATGAVGAVVHHPHPAPGPRPGSGRTVAVGRGMPVAQVAPRRPHRRVRRPALAGGTGPGRSLSGAARRNSTRWNEVTRRGPLSGHSAGRRGVRGGSVRRLPVFSKAAARVSRALSS